MVGLPHADFGEAVTAVVATGGASGLVENEVLKALESRLAAFKRPKRVLFVDELPRNAMGKVQKAALRERYAGAVWLNPCLGASAAGAFLGIGDPLRLKADMNGPHYQRSVGESGETGEPSIPPDRDGTATGQA